MGPSRRSLLSEWETAAGAEDVLGTGFSFFTDPTYPMWDFIVFKYTFSIILFDQIYENSDCGFVIPEFS